MEEQLFTIVIEQQSYGRIYVIWIRRIGSTWPRVVCYWNTNKVKERKFKKHYEREQGKQAKQCNLTNQVKKTKQKEEKYKNNNKIKDVKNMKKIIVQIYNNLQVLWSSKVKFVSLSQMLEWPLFGSTSGLFTVPGFIVSLVKGGRKKEGRRDKKGKQGRRNKKRKKERKKGVKRKRITLKKSSCWLPTGQGSSGLSGCSRLKGNWFCFSPFLPGTHAPAQFLSLLPGPQCPAPSLCLQSTSCTVLEVHQSGAVHTPPSRSLLS